MGKQLQSLTPQLTEFIQQQKIFFVGTAMDKGRVNISPKGLDTLRILDPNKLLWLNLTGSGNETATHLKYNNRITIMFCAFEGAPMILRLYGNATVFHENDDLFQAHYSQFPNILGVRQIIEVDFDLVQTSCGFAVPLMDFNSDRTLLHTWAEKKGDIGIKEYWKEKNSISLDGHNSGILKE